MASKIWPAALLLTLQFCHSGSVADKTGQMAGSLAACIARYDRLEADIAAKRNDARPGPDLDRITAAQRTAHADKKTSLEKLLREVETGVAGDQLDLLRSKIMIELGRLADAEKIIDRLSLAGSSLALEAKLQKVTIQLIRKNSAAALTLFREIEPQLKKDAQLYNIYLALAFAAPQAEAREEYSLKFLAGPELPAALRVRQAGVYANLASSAEENHQPEKAKGYLEKAMALNSDPALQAILAAGLKHMALVGQPAPPLQAETWFNTPPLTLAGFKGQVVVIVFWAPWCNPCRMAMDTLLDELRRFKNIGLQVIGYTKLYGRYGDDAGKKEKVGVAEELTLIKDYLDKNKITCPVAVGAEGLSFDAYAVTEVPTMIFIDRLGNIVHVRTGTGISQPIGDEIKSLLAEN
jgi:thiol-disulfide isomerase/thioredoxin